MLIYINIQESVGLRAASRIRAVSDRHYVVGSSTNVLCKLYCRKVTRVTLFRLVVKQILTLTTHDKVIEGTEKVLPGICILGVQAH